MDKHTPGPWETKHRKGSDAMYRTEIFSEQHGGIATCEWTPKHCGNGVTETYREANAHLISAAPELLAALELARDALLIWAPKDIRIEQINFAISKARGELFNHKIGD
jgi:hypothetical protein